MRIFLDTANIDEIKKWNETGILDGVTTNPTHLSKEKTEPTKLVKEICEIMKDGEVSVEVTETLPEKVYTQAKEIADIAENVIVKIPCHINYYEIIKKLTQEDVPLNITLVFSVLQGLAMCKLGVYYISPFIGRLDDAGQNGLELVQELCDMVDRYAFMETEVLAASIRDIKTFEGAMLAGADIATVPPVVLQQAFKHELTYAGMKKFLEDWNKLGITKFPC